MLRLGLGVLLVILAWKPLVGVCFWLAQGPDPRYDLGGGYEIFGPSPYVLVYWPLKEEPFDRIIDEPLLGFALSGSWIIGRTEKGWFSVNKQAQDVNYPQSEAQLRTATGLDISSLKMETDPTPYLMVKPKALAARVAANRLCWVLLFVLPAALGFGPLAVGKLVHPRKIHT